MEMLFAVVVVLLGLLFIVHRWRTVGIHDGPLWFVASSLVLINTGFLVRAIETQGGIDGWANEGILVVSFGLFMFMVGVQFQTAIQASRSRVVGWYRDEPVPVPASLATKRLLVVATLTFIPSWLYFYLLGYVPLFQGLDAVVSDGISGLGELQASRLSRDGYASANGVLIPGQGLMQLVRNVGVPATAAYAAAQLATYGRSPTRLIVLGLSCVTVLLAGQRWPLIYLCVALIAGASLSGKTLSARRVIQILLGIGVVGIALSVLQRRTLETFDQWGDAIGFAVGNLFNRIFFEQSLVPILSYERGVFPPGSLMGRSYLDSLMAYLPGPGASFPVEFYRSVTGSQLSYTAAPDLFTEAYINFSIIGLTLIPCVWGFVLASVTRRVFSKDITLNAGIVGGLIAILAQSCFTGPVFTLGGILIALALLAAASMVRGPVTPEQSAEYPRPSHVKTRGHLR